MKLIYVNKVGQMWDDNIIYEFLFGESIEDVYGEDWDRWPASGKPSPPEKEFVTAVGRVETGQFSLQCVQESDSFAVFDAVDNIVALAWEDIRNYDTAPESRLVFRYGEEITSVENKLSQKRITMNWNLVEQ